MDEKDLIINGLEFVDSHEQKNSSEEVEVYPGHEKRASSSLYKRNHHQLIHGDKIPCFFCNKTLEEVQTLGKNHTLETHHWFEYSLWNALDTEKVLADLEKLDFYGYADKMHGKPITTPDDIRNLMVLCSNCHRESGYGIHHATIPFVWARRALKDPNNDVLKRIKPMSEDVE